MSNESNENPEIQRPIIQQPPALIYTQNLYKPPIPIILYEVRKEMEQNFRVVTMSINFNTMNYINFAAQGLCGNTAIMEIGSLQYLFPRPQLYRKHCFGKILLHLNRWNRRNFIIGGGKHSNPPLYDHGDLTANVVFEALSHTCNGRKKLQNHSRVTWWDERRNVADCAKVQDTTCAMQGNFFLSEGLPGNVLCVIAFNRFGPYDFLTSIQRALSTLQLRCRNKLIGAGGVFATVNNDMMYHNMPSTMTSNMNTIEQVQQWLKYRQTQHMISVGTILSDVVGQPYLYRYYNNERQYMRFTRMHFHTITQNEKGGHLYTNDTIHNFADAISSGFFSFADKYHAVDCLWQPVQDTQPNRVIYEFSRPT